MSHLLNKKVRYQPESPRAASPVGKTLSRTDFYGDAYWNNILRMDRIVNIYLAYRAGLDAYTMYRCASIRTAMEKPAPL
jgi:hypothetical protein